MNLKLDVIKLANEDVIATSAVDHKTLRHAKIWNNPSYSVNVEGTNYEYGIFTYTTLLIQSGIPVIGLTVMKIS